MLTRLRSAILLGLAVGAIGALLCLTPLATRLEENAGLDALFELRGPRTPPDTVAIVSVERAPRTPGGSGARPEAWSRARYAELIHVLAAADARVIALDIFFDGETAADGGDTGPEVVRATAPTHEDGEPASAPGDGDTELAAAMRAAGNVVISARVNQGPLPRARAVDRDILTAEYRSTDGQPAGNPASSAATDEEVVDDTHSGPIGFNVQEPARPLRAAALATAPFPLPVVPIKVSQYWAFHEGAGDVATLPAVALQAWALPELATLARELDARAPRAGRPWPADRAALERARGLARFMRDARHAVLAVDGDGRGAPGSTAPLAAIGSSGERAVADLLRLYGGPASYYLNYYGPPHSIPTFPAERLLAGAAPVSGDGRPMNLRDRIVFVGFAARSQAEQRDGFYSVFSQDSGLNLSGVEIAATATANLLEGRPIRPLAPQAEMALLLAWGLYLGGVCRMLPGIPGVAAGVASAGLYLAGASSLFSTADIWLPLLVPLFLQAPLAVLGALLLQFRRVRDERERIRTALAHYVPPAMAERVAEEGVDTAGIAEIVYGTCMATDASQYTLMAETLAPDELGQVLNAYYDMLFADVERHDGLVSDVVGDAMMAIWASARPNARIRWQACSAALGIHATLLRATAAGTRAALPTRIGLHSGEIRLGNVGARHHLEFRAVGDIVNTASRIEGLNKHLGTRVLVSAATIEGVEGVVTRELGAFVLQGKTLPVVVHELLGCGETALDGVRSLADFAGALAEFRAQRWVEAGRLFGDCLAQNPDDGPAGYYTRLCANYATTGPTTFVEGAIRVYGK